MKTLREGKAPGGQKPWLPADEVNQFLLCLAEVLSSITPVPAEVMVRLGRDPKDADADLSPNPVAEPPIFYRIFSVLEEGARPTMGELSLSLGLPMSTLSRMISQLEERGWVERTPDLADGRVVRVVLTGDGRQVYDAVRSDALRNAQRLLGCLTRYEYRALSATLVKMTSRSKGMKRQDARDEHIMRPLTQ